VFGLGGPAVDLRGVVDQARPWLRPGDRAEDQMRFTGFWVRDGGT
jgi:hypothetical protein